MQAVMGQAYCRVSDKCLQVHPKSPAPPGCLSTEWAGKIRKELAIFILVTKHCSSKFFCLARPLRVWNTLESAVIEEQMRSTVDMQFLNTIAKYCIKKLVISDEFWDRVTNIHRLLQSVPKDILLLEGKVSQIGSVCRQHMHKYSDSFYLVKRRWLGESNSREAHSLSRHCQQKKIMFVCLFVRFVLQYVLRNRKSIENVIYLFICGVHQESK